MFNQVFLRIILSFDMRRYIAYKAQAGERILINRSHGVVYKKATKQQSEREYPHVMVSVLIKPTYSLGINHEHINFRPAIRIPHEWLCPHPEPLSTRVNRWADSKSPLVKDHSVQQVRFASTVHSSNCDHSDWPLELGDYFFGFRAYLEFRKGWNPLD